MKNLWLFLVRYNAVFLFLIFFVISLVLAIRNNDYQKSAVINSSNVLVGGFYEQFNSWKSYLDLRSTNNDLGKENAFLRGQLEAYLLRDTVDSLPVVDSVVANRYKFLTAEVVNNSVSQKSNFITLNKGRDTGIEPGMGVISTSGIVGVVVNTSKHFSTVRSLLHPDSKVSVVLDSVDVLGSVVWGNNVDPRFALVRDIPNHVKVDTGTLVRTSGYSLYPPGIVVGKVVETDITSGESFLDIRIQLTTNFNSIHHVYVVKDYLKDEKSQLEEQTQLEDNG